jgi:hypothetical protein
LNRAGQNWRGSRDRQTVEEGEKGETLMFHIFRHPTPAEIAVEQLEEAKRDLLRAEAEVEAFLVATTGARARSEVLRSRIKRLRERCEEFTRDAACSTTQ